MSHSHSNSFSSHHGHSLSQSGSNPNLAAILAAQQPPAASQQQGGTKMRVLLLENFSPALKTRDILQIFEPWEDQLGGFKVKWRDDVSAFVVFSDAATAKRAYLSLLSNKPESLQPTAEHTPSLSPYTGADAATLIAAVASRPRSRSTAGAGAAPGHVRKTSGSQGGSIGGAPVGGHARKTSFGRAEVGSPPMAAPAAGEWRRPAHSQKESVSGMAGIVEVDHERGATDDSNKERELERESALATTPTP